MASALHTAVPLPPHKASIPWTTVCWEVLSALGVVFIVPPYSLVHSLHPSAVGQVSYWQYCASQCSHCILGSCQVLQVERKGQASEHLCNS